MSDSMKEALRELLDAYDARRQDDAAREQRTKDDQAAFLAQFAELRRDVIRPVFEAACAQLEERGHRASIAEQEFTPGTAGRIGEASIALRIVPAGTKPPLHEDQRSLIFATRHYNRALWVNSGEAAGAGGMAGTKGALALNAVTRSLVEDEVVRFVARVVAA